jgi:hypothetical protein
MRNLSLSLSLAFSAVRTLGSLIVAGAATSLALGQACSTACPTAGAEIYVDAAIGSSGNGECWSTAKKTLREALTKVSDEHIENAVIYMAKGTYRPDQGPGVTGGDRRVRSGRRGDDPLRRDRQRDHQ